jgi:uncharacterized protein YukE
VAGFSANTTAMQSMAAQLTRMSTDVAAIREHLGKIDPSAFTGLTLPIRGRFEDVLHSRVSAAVDAQTAAYQAGNEISQTAASYQQQDQAQSAAFDAKIPGSPQRDWGYDLESTDKKNAPAYTDINDPQGRLIEPKDYQDDMQWKPNLETDVGNVVSFVRGAIQWILGVDPLQSCEELAAGNWAEIRQFSDRFNNASWAFRDCSDNIQNGQNSSEQDWTGNAADGARNYLVQLADGFYGEADRNEFLADQLKDFAEGVFDAMKVLTDILGDWVNAKLLPAIASIIVAGGTEEIPVVDLITDGVAGYTAYEAIQAGMEVYEQANKINTMIEAFTSSFGIINNGTFKSPNPDWQIPSAPYVSPVSG